jgi:hypothetical protein
MMERVNANTLSPGDMKKLIAAMKEVIINHLNSEIKGTASAGCSNILKLGGITDAL